MKKVIKLRMQFAFLLIALLSTGNFLFAQTTATRIESGEIIAYCYQPLLQGIHQIYVIDEDGSNNHILINTSIGLNHHDWSPDGQELAAVGYVDQSTWSIYKFNSDGTGLTRLTTTDNVYDSEPAWSPDGNKIAFTRTYYNQNFRDEIWVMNSDGSNQHYIGVEGYAAKWSPGGQQFIFTNTGGWGPPGLKGSDIMSCDTNGTNIQQITHTAGDEWYPSWSPDGNKILFGYSNDGNYASNEIYKMNSDTTEREQLTINNSWDGSPRWSSDGTRICYSSDISAFQQWEVYFMNYDGSSITRVTNSPPNVTAINPVWMPIDSSTSIIGDDIPLQNFQLYQNYPNPFNPSTTILYQIPERSTVSLKIYDLLGNEVEILVDEQKPAGSYEVEFDGSELTSGIYMYQLNAGSYSVAKKMLLVK